MRREVASSQVARIVTRSAFLEFVGDAVGAGEAAGAAEAGESISKAAAGSLPSHAPGARMTVVTQTPSNKERERERESQTE